MYPQHVDVSCILLSDSSELSWLLLEDFSVSVVCFKALTDQWPICNVIGYAGAAPSIDPQSVGRGARSRLSLNRS